jgi:diaminopimelate epimerase
MKFTKMQGLGNDYLYFFEEVPENVKELAIRMSDRHFGPGSDGLIYICSSNVADYKMRIFNADGSEAMMCGNGIRCVGKYVYDKGYTDKTELKIESMSGIKTLYLTIKKIGEERGFVERVTVDMENSTFEAEKTINVKVGENTEIVRLLPVSMGNPHAVIFTEDAENAPLTTLGAAIEKHEAFPGGVNVEFVQVLSETELRMRVWERGSGVTMACGTGTCATVMAAIVKGYCKYNTPVTVHLDGGDLVIEIKEDNRVFMTGPAEFVFEGDTDVALV